MLRRPDICCSRVPAIDHTLQHVQEKKAEHGLASRQVSPGGFWIFTLFRLLGRASQFKQICPGSRVQGTPHMTLGLWFQHASSHTDSACAWWARLPATHSPNEAWKVSILRGAGLWMEEAGVLHPALCNGKKRLILPCANDSHVRCFASFLADPNSSARSQ